MTKGEFDLILADETKRISGDVIWRQHPQHSFAVGFQIVAESASGATFTVTGYFNRVSKKLNFGLVPSGESRVFGICAGSNHHNPPCDWPGDPHMHSWTTDDGDKHAEPLELATPDDVVSVWREFCARAKLLHEGRMEQPPTLQMGLF